MPAPPAGADAGADAAADVCAAGIGWRHPHYAAVLEDLPRIGFLEVHSENFFAPGGAALATLEQARRHYGISLHGVGLGLGSASGIDPWHLDRLHRLVERIGPVLVSDHACFARGFVNGIAVHAADLLPIPFNKAALNVLCSNVQQVQDRLARVILVENLSAYVQMPGSDRSETEFLSALAQRTGCKLLVDMNNIYVNALNGIKAIEAITAKGRASAEPNVAQAVGECRNWLDGIPQGVVGEIHLAGHCNMEDIVIDDHGAPVCGGVWQVYEHAVRRFGPVPTLVEWDTAIPSLQVLLDEARRADAIQRQVCNVPSGQRPMTTHLDPGY